jgi:hypothetical protein
MHIKDLEMGLGLCPNVPIMRIPIFTFTKKNWLLKLTKNFSVSVPCPFLFLFFFGGGWGGAFLGKFPWYGSRLIYSVPTHGWPGEGRSHTK